MTTDLIFKGGVDVLSVGESFVVNRLIPIQVVSDHLTLLEASYPFSYEGAFGDYIAINEAFTCTINVFGTTDVLILSESFSAHVLNQLGDELVIGESFIVNPLRPGTASDALLFNEVYYAYIDSRPLTQCEFTTPQAGPVQFKLGSYELDCRRYNFGDLHQTEYSRVNRESLGGTPLYGNTTLRVNTLTVQFEFVDENMADELIDFLAENLGCEIEFRDHEGVWHDAVPTNGQLTKTAPRRGIYSVEDVTLELLT
jgi:hypothetical protein